MKAYKFFWDTHKWTGIVLAVVLLNVAATGFLLLIKKDYAWIQPPTQSGTGGTAADFLPLREILAAVYATGHPAFRSFEDIDRIDTRPGKRIHKVQSVHDHWEIQVDAITGEIRSTEQRLSDWLESVHDGSFFGAWVHDGLMLLVPVGLVFLVGSGLYLWLEPKVRRRRRRRAAAS